MAVAMGALACGAVRAKTSPRRRPPRPRRLPTPLRRSGVVGPLSEAESQALATMNAKVRDYVVLHRKLKRRCRKCPTQATPDQIDSNQRAFEQLVRERARSQARRSLHAAGAAGDQAAARRRCSTGPRDGS